MTTYNGYLVVRESSDHVGGRANSPMAQGRSRITADKPYLGASSLEILPGGVHDVYYGCDAGEVTVSVWCWPPVGTGVGKCAIEILPLGGGSPIVRTLSVGTAAWEKLSATFTALKQVYRVRLINRVQPTGDTRAWFDDLE